MNITLITSNKPRHLYFINRISETVEIGSVFIIKKENPSSVFDELENIFFSEHRGIKRKYFKTYEFDNKGQFFDSLNLVLSQIQQ